jgi:hypothetical protein
MVLPAEGPVRTWPFQIDAVSPSSWPYRTRTTVMLRPLGAQHSRSTDGTSISEADLQGTGQIDCCGRKAIIETDTKVDGSA